MISLPLAGPKKCEYCQAVLSAPKMSIFHQHRATSSIVNSLENAATCPPAPWFWATLSWVILAFYQRTQPDAIGRVVAIRLPSLDGQHYLVTDKILSSVAVSYEKVGQTGLYPC